MTDQTIPADEVRTILDGDGSAADKIQALRDMLPPPPPSRPTLADMAEEERRACRRMQCDHGIPGHPQSRGVIGYFDHGDEKVLILTDTRGIVRRDYDSVTPRPDLPRLAWPGDPEHHDEGDTDD